MTVMSIMPFGKYKNRSIDQVPSGYLDWLTTTELRDPLRAAVVAELERRKNAPTSRTANGPPRVPARRGSEHRPASELPARTVCDRCGLPATAQKPLVHEACLHDEAPF
jgi:Putative quorum-sensing-regulated virulence factor